MEVMKGMRMLDVRGGIEAMVLVLHAGHGRASRVGVGLVTHVAHI